MEDICRSGKLRISLVTEQQPFYFRVHNASDPTLARYYARYREEGFVLWTEGEGAVTLWRSLDAYLEEDKEDRLFRPLKIPVFDDDKKQQLKKLLTRKLNPYFHGIAEKITTIFLGNG